MPLLTLALCVALQAEPATVPSTQLAPCVEQALLTRRACGPIALWYCLRRHGIEQPCQELIAEAAPSDSGTSLAQLVRMADQRGLSAEAVTIRKDALLSLATPTLIVINRSHAVAFDGLDPATGRCRVFDPLKGRIVLATQAEVTKLWDGQAIVFESPRMSTSAFVALNVLGSVTICMGAVVAIQWLTARAQRQSVQSSPLAARQHA